MQLFTYILTYPILYGVSILPYPLLYLLSDFMFFLLYHVFGFRKKVVRGNLKLALANLSVSERKKIERNFYRHLCDVFLEMAKNLTISEKEIKKRFQFENIEIINDYEKQNQSTILLLGHFSNWEGMLSIGYHLLGNAFGVYTPLSNKYFNRLIGRSRERHKAFLLSRYKTVEFIRENEKNKNVSLYGFINDQSPRVKPKSYWRTFMGVKVPVFTGADRLAREFNFPVIYCGINRVKRGYYVATFSMLEDNPANCAENEITDKFTEKLEAQIKEDPAQYLWSHNRFKYRHLIPKHLGKGI